MNNEPVAWINFQKWKDTSSYLEDCVADMKLESAGIVTPLYAYPAKTLTDEEIQAIAKESYVWNTGKQEWSEIEFARAILRKAQEK
jgi:hypothetical protein